MPTTQFPRDVVTTGTLQPNSYFLCAFPFAMHATSGACTEYTLLLSFRFCRKIFSAVERRFDNLPSGFGHFLRMSRITRPRYLSLIHISEPTRLGMTSYAVFCLKKKKQQHK